MSLLTATSEDTKAGGVGKPLPDRVWTATVLAAVTESSKKGVGKRVAATLGQFRDRDGSPQITLADGSTYTPGNRKVFDRQWFEYPPNAQAEAIGQKFLKRQAMSAGLMPVPRNGDKAELTFDSWDDYADALVGREVTVRTKQVRAQVSDGNGSYVDAFEDDGVTPKYNVEVGDYLPE